jgi:hypothetical protein
MNKHTPLPWKILGEDKSVDDIPYIEISVDKDFGDDFKKICKVDCTLDWETGDVLIADEDKSNAEFIVRACNSHYELISLVEKCIKLEKSRRDKLAKGCIAYTFADQRIEELEASLKKAKG